MRYILSGVFCLLMLAAPSSHAGLLNLSSSLELDPWADITVSFAKATYDAATKSLLVTGTAVAIDYDGSAPPDASVLNGGVGNPASFIINIQVDNDGTLIGGNAGHDLEIKGRIANGPHPSPVYGDLLTAEIYAFGYATSAPFIMEFKFWVTGGNQAAQFGSEAGVIFNTVSGFSGSFANNFTTSTSGSADTFALPEPASAALLAVGMAALAIVGRQAPRRRKLRRLQRR